MMNSSPSFWAPKNTVLVLMITAMILGYLPWYNFSAVLREISLDLQLTSVQTGIILSSFQAGYVIVVLITGWLADEIGTKRVVAWATFSTAVFSTLFVWLAQGFYSVLIMRLLTGLSAGAIYVPGMALLANWFPAKERGRALGAYTGALTIAYAGGYFIASPLAAAYGWQTGILWTSLPAFLAAGIVFFFIGESPRELSQEEDQNLRERAEVLPAPKGGYQGPLLITTGYMGHMWELYAFWGWIGPFMVAAASAVGFQGSAATALGGRLAALIILLGAPAVWLFGLVADQWGRTKTIILCSLSSLTVLFFFGFLYGRNLTLVVGAGLWIGFWVIADSAIYKAGLTEMVSLEIRSTALGIQSAVGYCMTIIAPFVFGSLLGRLNPSIDHPTQATRWGLPFLMLGAGALLAPLSMFFLRKVTQARLMAGGRR